MSVQVLPKKREKSPRISPALDLLPAGSTLKMVSIPRYNEDKKRLVSTTVLWNATDVNFTPCFAGIADQCSRPSLGGTADNLFSRVPNFVTGADASGTELQLIDRYAPDADVEAAEGTPARSPERLAIHAAVPVAPTFNEARALNDNPNSFTWKEWSGRTAARR